MTDLYVGLMSGTSLDGIDAVLVSFGDSHVNLHAAQTKTYPPELRQSLLKAIREPLDVALDSNGHLHREVGRCFAAAARVVIEHSGANAASIKAIGSHGQTLRHQPNAAEPFSLQVGCAAIIADITSITTVNNFRQADIAAGGQGAPLVPAFHEWLFRSKHVDRVVVNIGGISNVTILPAGTAPTGGFDTGPGNGLMDIWSTQHLGKTYDLDGQWAASGNVNETLLQDMMRDDYFRLEPPKSTGFEYFNADWLTRFDLPALSTTDVQATLCELTSRTIAAAISRYAADTRQLLVCGGGVHNKALMASLRRNISATEITSTRIAGLDPDWVEAAAFAWLAMRSVHRKTGNLPSVTGASHKVVLGNIHSP